MDTKPVSNAKLSGGTSLEKVESVILNATQHQATPEQLEAGIVDLKPEIRQELGKLLTFEELPTSMDLRVRSIQVTGLLLAQGAKPGDRIMIGGAPFFMEELADTMRRAGLRPCYAFSRRESVDQHQADGSVRKTAVFRHVGLIEAHAPQP
jgi:hypothetical protein